MGLSRKLGGGGGTGASRAVEVSCGRVDYTWSTQAYTMREILTRFRLPCVVQCSGDAGAVLWADFRFDMRQPLLLHAARTVRKVHARSLKVKDKAGCELEEFGPPLAIPEDYDGWFFPVGRKDPTVLPRHTRIESVANSPSHQFLVTTTLPAFMPANGPNTGVKHIQHEVTIGEVLTKVGVVKGEPSVTSSPSALLQRSRQSLRCVDENQHEVIIPFNHRALLFDVAENYGPPTHTTLLAGAGEQAYSRPSKPGVVHTNTLVTVGNKYLPRVFRHVLGELPAVAHAFTGMLRCYSVFTEETVMAAAMSGINLSSLSQESSCLELATDSSAKFKIALNASDLKRTNQYALALQTCEEQAPSYVRAIKTSFTVQPVESTVLVDDLDLSMYDHGQDDSEKDFSDTDPVKIRDVMQANAASLPSAHLEGKSELVSVVHVDTKSEPEEKCDDVDSATDEAGDDNSVATDDVANSIVDTASQSDATDILFSDGVSDVVEVEANSEFDFSWGQLKRARSFSGSMSTLTDDSGTRSPDSDSESEDCMVAPDQDDPDSSFSHNSTLTNDTISSRSGDTVVLRNSAPSPVYANVQKKTLSVFGTGEASADSPVNKLTGVSGSEERDTEFQVPDESLIDNTVRSVWNITLTVDEVNHARKDGNSSEALNISVQRCGALGYDDADPICWGDGHIELLLDSDEAILELQHKLAAIEERDSSIKEQHPQHPGNVVDHTKVSSRLSTGSTSGSHLKLAPHQLLSAKSSAHSEGSMQDLAIQRLERALNEATVFLKSGGAPGVSTAPVPPPRRGKLSVAQSGEVFSSADKKPDYSSQDRLQTAIFVSDNADPGLSEQSHTASVNSLTIPNPSSATASHPDSQTAANFTQDFPSDLAIRSQAPHYQSDPHMDLELASHHETAHHRSDGQIDLDFVKTLGDKLMAVSRKSSLPRYQRLLHDTDVTVLEDSEGQDSHQHFRKKKQRALSHQAVDHREEDMVNAHEGLSGRREVAFDEEWGSVDSSQREAILDDFDLLAEEVV